MVGTEVYWCQEERRYDVVYDEEIFDQHRPVNVILLMREPLSQIISTYNMLKGKEEKGNCIDSKLKCSFDECVDDKVCYDSIFSKTASHPIGEANYYDMSRKFWFIGITEYYYTSLCMLRYKLGKYSSDICDCNKRNPNKILHEDHGVVHNFNISTTSNRIKNILKNDLTIDMKLYNISLSYFKYELQTLEFQSGIKFSCDTNH